MSPVPRSRRIPLSWSVLRPDPIYGGALFLGLYNHDTEQREWEDYAVRACFTRRADAEYAAQRYGGTVFSNSYVPKERV